LVTAPRHDLVLLDGRRDLAGAMLVSRIIQAANWSSPTILLVGEAGLPAINTGWGASDFILEKASLAEVDARVRSVQGSQLHRLIGDSSSGLVIDVSTYTVTIGGQTLDLTYREFELLRYLNNHPSQVFSRKQLLSEV
jgi:DNA-binding response OmpR family regulator